MFNQLLAALRYGIRAQTKYYLHSPFVYALAENVIYDPIMLFTILPTYGVRS